MAKLHDYYILCPLIDQKSFLGVTKAENDDHVIVTLGRNVANKYRLSDQKLVSGWTSKDHITSEVIYNTDQNNYVGVFNKNTIKFWNEDSTHLDKVKKYKFPINIKKLLARSNQPPLIIFTDGNCASLPYAIENRKSYESRPIMKDSNEVVDIATFTINNMEYICYLMKSEEGYEILYCSLRDELGDLERASIMREKIAREEGLTVVQAKIQTSYGKCGVYVLWSDSKMTFYNFLTNKWKTAGCVPWMSTNTTVSMASMGQNHLILFGSNIDQDGAIIVAYNYELGIGSCKYPMKMYKENAKIYCYHNHIILEASNHIGMLPYLIEKKRNLSSLLGTHEVSQKETLIVANWDTPTTPTYNYLPEMKDAIKLGITERNMCAQIIPALLDKYSPTQLKTVIQGFKDVPENVLALLLHHAIKLIITDESQLSSKESMLEVINNEIDSDACELLISIFGISFCDALVIPHLRHILSIDESLFLLVYIAFIVFDSDMAFDADFESKLYDWCSIIVDAFYQQYLISKDTKVTSILQDSHDSLQQLIQQLFTMSQTMAELNQLLAGEEHKINDEYLSYSIEMMQI